LIVGCPEAAAHVLVVQHLHLERKILLQLSTEQQPLGSVRNLWTCTDASCLHALSGGEIATRRTEKEESLGENAAQGQRGGKTHILDNHDQEGQFDTKCLVLVCRASDVVGGHIRTHDFKHARLDVLISDALNVAIANLLIPNLQRLAANAVQDRQEARLKGVFKHAASPRGSRKTVSDPDPGSDKWQGLHTAEFPKRLVFVTDPRERLCLPRLSSPVSLHNPLVCPLSLGLKEERLSTERQTVF